MTNVVTMRPMRLTGNKINEIRKALRLDTLAFADLLLVRSRNTVYGWEGYRDREPPMHLYAKAVLLELAKLKESDLVASAPRCAEIAKIASPIDRVRTTLVTLAETLASCGVAT